MKQLDNIFKERGIKFLNDLKDYVVVTEKLSGSSFAFQREGEKLIFYKGNSENPINLIDRTLMVYYESAINYINKKINLEDLPNNWRFCFQYFVHNEPGIIKYDNLPKNNLVLTHIKVINNNGKTTKLIEDQRVINEWSKTLKVTPLTPIFSGYLTNPQKQKIANFLSTPKSDHQEIFKTNSFAEYLINILNPSLSKTTLQEDLTKPIDSIIFKFYKATTSKSFAAKLIDPYTLNLIKERDDLNIKRSPADINEIVLLDLLAFIEQRGIKKHDTIKGDADKRYIELMSSIFNEYVSKRGDDLNDLSIEKADFVKGDEFKINLDLITNKKTKKYLGENSTLQDLFKIILGSFRKRRNTETYIMTSGVIKDFNKVIDKINELINSGNDKFKTFGDYLELKEMNESYDPDFLLNEREEIINEYLDMNKIYIKDYQSFKTNINERKIPVTIDNSVVGSVDHNDQEAISTIKRIASSSEGKLEVKAFLSTIGIPDDSQAEVIRLLADGDWATGSSYLLNRTLDVKSILGKKLSSYDVNKKLLGMGNKKVSDKFFSFQWPTQPPMGKGEAWLSIMIKGANKAGVGDVTIEGNNTEVKGVGARLVGQHGYGSAKQMPDAFKKALKNMASQFGILDFNIKDGNGLQWSVTKTTPRLLGENLQALVKQKGKLSSSDIKFISSEIMNAYKTLYVGLQLKKYSDSLIPAISSDGIIDVDKFNKEMLKVSFDYYLQVEQFVYFALTNKKTGNFLIIKPKDFSKFVDNGTVLYSPPSWGDRAGTQGGFFSVGIDKLS